jgi:hypothetical protein
MLPTTQNPIRDDRPLGKHLGLPAVKKWSGSKKLEQHGN